MTPNSWHEFERKARGDRPALSFEQLVGSFSFGIWTGAALELARIQPREDRSGP